MPLLRDIGRSFERTLPVGAQLGAQAARRQQRQQQFEQRQGLQERRLEQQQGQFEQREQRLDEALNLRQQQAQNTQQFRQQQLTLQEERVKLQKLGGFMDVLNTQNPTLRGPMLEFYAKKQGLNTKSEDFKALSNTIKKADADTLKAFRVGVGRAASQGAGIEDIFKLGTDPRGLAEVDKIYQQVSENVDGQAQPAQQQGQQRQQPAQRGGQAQPQAQPRAQPQASPIQRQLQQFNQDIARRQQAANFLRSQGQEDRAQAVESAIEQRRAQRDQQVNRIGGEVASRALTSRNMRDLTFAQSFMAQLPQTPEVGRLTSLVNKELKVARDAQNAGVSVGNEFERVGFELFGPDAFNQAGEFDGTSEQARKINETIQQRRERVAERRGLASVRAEQRAQIGETTGTISSGVRLVRTLSSLPTGASGLRGAAAETLGGLAGQFSRGAGRSISQALSGGATPQQRQQAVTRTRAFIAQAVPLITGEGSSRVSDKELELTGRAAAPVLQPTASLDQALGAAKEVLALSVLARTKQKILGGVSLGFDPESPEAVARLAQQYQDFGFGSEEGIELAADVSKLAHALRSQ